MYTYKQLIPIAFSNGNGIKTTQKKIQYIHIRRMGNNFDHYKHSSNERSVSINSNLYFEATI